MTIVTLIHARYTNPTYPSLTSFNLFIIIYLYKNSQTDCDEDAQCGPGLICFQRNSLETVPGCSGEDNLAFDRKDVCVTKCTTEYCVLHRIGNDINPGTGYYGKCEVSRIKIGMITFSIAHLQIILIKLIVTYETSWFLYDNRVTVITIQIAQATSNASNVISVKMYQVVLATQ